METDLISFIFLKRGVPLPKLDLNYAVTHDALFGIEHQQSLSGEQNSQFFRNGTWIFIDP